MAKVSPATTSFNSGEFSPLMAGRFDLKYYASACKKLFNFIPMPQGPVRRRPGTRMVEEVKDSSARCWLRRFIFNQDQSYMLEFGHLYIRFYSNHGRVGGGSPVEVVTPFTAASLTATDGTLNLRFTQSGDVLYITSNGQYPTQKLTRTGASSFSIAELDTQGGPFESVDPDNTVTIYASAATGSVTLVASTASFVADHVGSLILLEQKNIDDIKQWEVGKVINTNDVRRSDGKNYKALNTATTGNKTPVHSLGARYDGDAGVQWLFLDAGFGYAKITAFTDTTHVTATVISQIPNGAVGSGNATTRWAFGSFSKVNGYPSNVSFFRERLCLAKDRNIHMSVVSDFENFSARDESGLITKDMAARIDTTSEEANDILWMSRMNSALLVGTGGEEYAIRENSPSEAFGPGNIRADTQTSHGSKNVMPVVVGAGVLFVQKAGHKIRDMIQAESVEERWVASDSTILAEHVTKSGVIQMAFQQEPDSVVWVLRSDGLLAGFTLNREQDVRGWHPHGVGGYSDVDATKRAAVESIDVIPVSGGDELWMIVRRYIDGGVKRYVEYMSQHFASGDDSEDANYMDSSLSINNVVNATLTPGTGANVVGTIEVVFTADSAIFNAGDVDDYIVYRYSITNNDGNIIRYKAIARITEYTDTAHVKGTILIPWPDLGTIAANMWHMTVDSVSGIDHLEGETVTILADGAVYPDFVVSGGTVVLVEPASKITVGLPYISVVTPMPLEAGASDGTSQGKTKRISRCTLRFSDTLGARYGRSEISQMDVVLSRDGGGLMDAPPNLFTGDVSVSWPDGYTDSAEITVMQDLPLPCTLVAIMPQMVTQDNR